MQQSVSFHVGQFGIQSGQQTWKVLCSEHGIDLEGYAHLAPDEMENRGIHTFFEEQIDGKWLIRANWMDSDEVVVECLLSSSLKNVINPATVRLLGHGSSCTFTRACMEASKHVVDCVGDVQFNIEKCQNFSTFFKHSALGGGNGSGLSSMIMTELYDQHYVHSGIASIGCHLLPSKTLNNLTVEHYNATFALTEQKDIFSLNCCFDNEAFYQHAHIANVADCTYFDINCIYAQVQSSLTAPSRFHNALSGLTGCYPTNLVPFPFMSHVCVGFSPLLAKAELIDGKHFYRDSKVNEFYTKGACDITKITRDVLRPDGHFVACSTLTKDELNPKVMIRDKLIAIALLYRGGQVDSEFFSCQRSFHTQLNHVAWNPSGVKIEMCEKPCTWAENANFQAARPNFSVLKLMNSTCIGQKLRKIAADFDLCFVKKSFIHHFEGYGSKRARSAHFVEARENIQQIIDMYDLDNINEIETFEEEE